MLKEILIGAVLALIGIFVVYDKVTECRIWFNQPQRPSILTK